MSINEIGSKKTKRRNKTLNKISFDAEIVPKNVAEQIVAETRNDSKNLEVATQLFNRREKIVTQNESETIPINEQKKQKRKHKSKKYLEANTKTLENPDQAQNSPKKTKRKPKNITEEKNDNEDESLITHLDTELNDNTKEENSKKESIRAQKRRKHEQLLLEKRLKLDLDIQSKCLNYLSQWKHNKDEWKFEKLRQVWLQQNMFDSEKIPNNIWETLLEYFDGAKGKIRQTILDSALKIIETDDKGVEESSADENTKKELNNKRTQLSRARSIVQCLQE